MENPTCQTCARFHQHYGISEGKIFRLHCGHCVYPKMRNKRPTATACQHYVFAPPEEDNFVSRHYLTKKLLQHILNMELMPPIEDAPLPKEKEK